MRQFLEQFRTPCGIGEMEFIVDSRVVLHDGSSLDGFFYRIPMKENSVEFEKDVLSLVADEVDREFVRFALSGQPLQECKLRRRILTEQEYDRLKAIYSRYSIQPRTAKWFRVITESGIPADLETTGSEEMTFTEPCALEIARVSDLQLAWHEMLE